MYKLRVNHLCFADDLLIFLLQTRTSVHLVKMVLAEFDELSSLKVNPSESQIFCAVVDRRVKEALVVYLHRKEGCLPVR